METNMAEIDTLRAGRHEWVGEIGRPVVRPTRPDDIPVDVFFKLLFRRMFRRD
jgi:hypothetical protein